MIVDFRSLPADSQIDADICIVGTGPAGLALAREFFGTTLRIVVLESGGLRFESASAELNAGRSVGLRHAGLTQGRRRQFGGAANIWGAVCVELDAQDFACRPWIPNSGWPLGAGDLAPFYDRARALFRLERTDFGEADWRAFGMETASFDPERVRFSVAGTTPIPDLGKSYRDDFRSAANLKVLLHSTVTKLTTNAEGTAIERVEFRSPEGKSGSVKARTVVLCCGGIENARLLLASREAHREGLGNGHDLVGRYLADHTFSLSARIVPASGKTLHPFFRALRRGHSSLRPRFSLPPERQERAGVLNCMAQVHFEHPADAGFAAALSLRRAVRYRRMPDDLGRDIFNVVRHPRELAAKAFDRYVRGRHPADDDAEPWLETMAEQAPNPDSRITLSGCRDRFGVPLPVVDWRASDIERRTIAAMTDAVAREFLRLGLGKVLPQPWLADDGTTAWRTQLVEGYHHMGTTRMSLSPRTGVVNADGQVHDVAGLYVGGSSVFPASGYANATLTIVALAIRLADHLKYRMRHAGDLHPAITSRSGRTTTASSLPR
jgi:choline dehydrogenase-like flavoprotein